MADEKTDSNSWVSDNVGDQFHANVTSSKARSGRQTTFDQNHGSWEESFQYLYSFKAELEKRCPGNIVEIDCERVGNKVYFSKIFVALKPCIDGFVHSCRPYVGVGSTHLTGKWAGRLAAASGIDGHDWLFPVAYGVFDSESVDNWTWFLSRLRKVIGSPPGLVISSDTCNGLADAVASVFPDSEHRECMSHVMEEFNRTCGDVFTYQMWLAAKAYTIDQCRYHLNVIKKVSPAAISYLERNHKQPWCRSKFLNLSKCEHVNRNISKSFDNWIEDLKDLSIVDLVDLIRQRIMVTFYKRRTFGKKLQGVILPNVIKELDAKSKNVAEMTVCTGGNGRFAEVSGIDTDGSARRHVVEFDTQECTCGKWQISGLPCIHAIAMTRSLRARLEDHVHEYCSLNKFKVAYAGVIRPMSDKSQWMKHDPGFKIHPLKRPPGRPRKEKISGCPEKKSKK